MGLTPNNKTRINLFEKSNSKYQTLIKTLDLIIKKEGVSKIQFAS